MANKLTFYTNPLSRGRVVRWMLEEVGASYSTEVLDFAVGAHKAPAYLAINPMGKVPAIKHGDIVMTETPAICAYLADVFPAANLAPTSNNPLRGPYYRWLFFTAGPIEQAITAKACGWEVPEERQGMVGFGSLKTVLDTIEDAIKDRDYVVGDSFTAADLYLTSALGWGMNGGTIEKRSAFETYVARSMQRPAYIRANDIDNKLLAANK